MYNILRDWRTNEQVLVNLLLFQRRFLTRFYGCSKDCACTVQVNSSSFLFNLHVRVIFFSFGWPDELHDKSRVYTYQKDDTKSFQCNDGSLKNRVLLKMIPQLRRKRAYVYVERCREMRFFSVLEQLLLLRRNSPRDGVAMALINFSSKRIE